MSNHLAIATVTATLLELLDEEVKKYFVNPNMTTKRPDKEMMSVAGVNIFLYQITPNPYMCNNELPTRNAVTGRLVQRPRAAFNLHYLLSFFGDEIKLEPQLLLGIVTRFMHTQPILHRNQIEKASRGQLEKSDLADERELVKFSPLALSLEELTKLWSSFFQVSYSLSVAYQASIVFIESNDAVSAPLPVRRAAISALPFQPPRIDSVFPPILPYESAAEISIKGSNLLSGSDGGITKLRLGHHLLTSDAPLQANRLKFRLPDDITAGVHSVQVQQHLSVGNARARSAYDSNITTLVIQPVILGDVSFNQQAGSDNNSAAQQFKVQITPAIAVHQRVELLLNAFEPMQQQDDPVEQPLNFSILGPTRVGSGSLVVFETTGIPPGRYLVRIRVDGAESNFQIDEQPNSTTFNMPIKPIVEVR